MKIKVKFNFHLFKFPIENVIKKENVYDISFIFMKRRVHLEIEENRYKQNEFIYVLTEPTFYKKKPELFLYDFEESTLRHVYIDMIVKKINQKEHFKLKKKGII